MPLRATRLPSSLEAFTAEHRAVVVAGAGNGAALAQRFAAEGRPVAMLSRDKAHAAALAARVAGARGYACDVGDAASVKACFALVSAECTCSRCFTAVPAPPDR